MTAYKLSEYFLALMLKSTGSVSRFSLNSVESSQISWIESATSQGEQLAPPFNCRSSAMKRENS
jgi:hypothetical protein